MKTRYLLAALMAIGLLAVAYVFHFSGTNPGTATAVPGYHPGEGAASQAQATPPVREPPSGPEASTLEAKPQLVRTAPAPSLELYLDTAFTDEWVEQWFKGTCTDSSRPGHDCLFEPASAISKGAAGGNDEWADAARVVLTSAAESAKRSRPGSDYRARCNASGCILVFATPLPGAFLTQEDLPGFQQRFAGWNERISWMGCPGCWNANLDLIVVVRNVAMP
jgi:hypothetical protein